MSKGKANCLILIRTVLSLIFMDLLSNIINATFQTDTSIASEIDIARATKVRAFQPHNSYSGTETEKSKAKFKMPKRKENKHNT